MANYKQSLKDVKTLTNNMDLYQADANKPCLSLKCVIMEEKSWKSSYSMWLFEISIKKISWHNRDHKTTIKTDNFTQMCCRSFKFIAVWKLPTLKLLWF